MFPRAAWIGLITLGILIPFLVYSQAASVAGEWHGLLITPVGDIPLTLRLQQSSNGTWSGSADIPGQQAGGTQLSAIAVSAEAVSFSLQAPGTPVFRGILVNEGSGISGELRQGSGRIPVKFARKIEDLTRVTVADDTVSIDEAVGLPGDRPFLATFRHSAIAYSSSSTADAVAALNRSIQEGAVKLQFDDTAGYLRSLLDALKIPAESQLVVFSKTSVQSSYISPENPRALFFNDNVVVGFIRHAPLLEVATQDARQGVIFYVLQQLESEKPQLTRSESRCLGCHVSRNSMDVPGMLVRSVISGPDGSAFPQFGNYVSDHRSPFHERWGGWHITGTSGRERHLANVMLREPNNPGSLAAASSDKFNLRGYPAHGSDGAAVLVFDHQMHMMNLLTRVGWEARVALQEQARGRVSADTVDLLLANNAREFVDYLLFVDEAPLLERFSRSSSFARQFSERGPADLKGRSLRELDLERRLMRYPCSYMIYSDAFDALPPAMKSAIYRRMWDVLSGQDKESKYARLSPSDRAAVIEILRDTKKDLPDYFTGSRNP